ncbi:alpha-L-fucosidase [Novipirellula artificiosorum]|uniref:alpha-L-fucosidase n=1 Tax=Novipirellula artificiosorum TaxID=2528016 RepID=A0A5C6DTK3_9BACT|nr:alpha-L-fucosidase [Novipirellula artificiosorum]TWU38356.1 Alpha-L-fucosidase [Novipirellula artificiosorum]
MKKNRIFGLGVAGIACFAGMGFGVCLAETPNKPSEVTADSGATAWPSVPMPKFEIADGPFAPNWDSLRKFYVCPEWFRDAKFGVWAHWGPQSQAEAGDWYSRSMYIEGHPQYQHHVETYGHPSKHGAKDLMCEWKAERFDPDELIQFYQQAGARYFAFMVNHHDNFDSWDSKYQPWNSVNIGPQKDLCRLWADAARKHGLRFGVTFHNTPYRCWNTFMPAWYGCDRSGTMAGVPYDGAVAAKADGKGTPWEGLDPRDLYGPIHKENEPCPEFVQQFLLRVDDLIQNYQPDLLYFDDAVYHLLDKNESLRLNAVLGMPDLLPQIAAHYYNSNLKWNNGRMEAVLNIKHVAATPLMEEMLSSAVVNDFEMKDPDKPFEHPWQTDTSLGSWHYRKNDRYRSAERVIHHLISIVANNGNMLLNVAPRGDGTIDAEQRRIVKEIGDWLRINGEAIYGTRPWTIAREGNIRFTRDKTNTILYATFLDWPGEEASIPSLAGVDRTSIQAVRLLGIPQPLTWQTMNDGLKIEMPKRPDYGIAYPIRIEFDRELP